MIFLPFLPATPSNGTFFFFFAQTNFQNDAVEISREAQIASIESSFAAVRSAEQLSLLHHPTKPRLCAVATYEVLPDADVWANAYNLFRFSK